VKFYDIAPPGPGGSDHWSAYWYEGPKLVERNCRGQIRRQCRRLTHVLAPGGAGPRSGPAAHARDPDWFDEFPPVCRAQTFRRVEKPGAGGVCIGVWMALL
jgi:hypothetical protein